MQKLFWESHCEKYHKFSLSFYFIYMQQITVSVQSLPLLRSPVPLSHPFLHSTDTSHVLFHKFFVYTVYPQYCFIPLHFRESEVFRLRILSLLKKQNVKKKIEKCRNEEIEKFNNSVKLSEQYHKTIIISNTLRLLIKMLSVKSI